jgi:hypothetical protein
MGKPRSLEGTQFRFKVAVVIADREIKITTHVLIVALEIITIILHALEG